MRMIFHSVLAMLFSLSAFAYEGQCLEVGSQAIWIAPPADAGDIERELMTNLTGVLRNYSPNPPKKIRKYGVWGNGAWTAISFNVSTSIVTSVDFGATVKRPRRSNNCPATAVASYYLEFDLANSEKAVRKNASAFGMDMCVYTKGKNAGHDIQATFWLKEGYDRNGHFDEFKKFLSWQAFPLLQAIDISVHPRPI